MSNYTIRFTKTKETIKFIFHYSCVCCGVESLELHVHHNDKNRDNNDCFNLVPLCTDCHIFVHKCASILTVNYTFHQIEQLKKLNAFWCNYK